MAVVELPLLAPAKARAALAQVLEQRRHWRRRDFHRPFFTLGAVAYRDALGGFATYEASFRELNPRLAREFDWLYARLTRALHEHLGAPVVFRERAARPGFQIWRGHPDYAREIGNLHVDAQYRLLRFGRRERIDRARLISFTVPLALPRAGGALETLHGSVASYDRLDPEAREAWIARSGRRHPYRVGRLYLHHGLLLHRPAPTPGFGARELRVTLQGHGIHGDGAWQLYW